MNLKLHSGHSLLYATEREPSHPRQLLVLSHGVGGNETNLASFAERAPSDTVVVLPRAPLSMGPHAFGWFQVAFEPQGPRPDLLAAESSSRRLASFVAEMQVAYGIAPAETIVAGFSQGGIVSANVALTRPELVGGFGILAGRILPEIEPYLAHRDALAHVRGFIGHARDDTKLPIDWARRATAWLTRLGIAHVTHWYDGDHGIPADMRDDFLSWMVSVRQETSSA